MNYYERHLGDYARDTGHLTMVEHGAYTLLLDRYYATEQGIPEAQAMRVARARTDEEREAVAAVLEEFFTLVDGVWVHGRVEGELEKAHHRIDAARENGRKGGRPRKETQQKPGGFSVGSENETGSKAHQAPSSKLQSAPCKSSHTPAEPAAPLDAVGRFEGQGDQQAGSNPAAPHAIALTRAGFACTAMNPELVAFARDGGTVEHLLQTASLPECRGKKAGYVLSIARRELATLAAAVDVHVHARAGPAAAAPSKTLSAIQTLQGMKSNGHLATRRDSGRAEPVALPEPRTHAGR